MSNTIDYIMQIMHMLLEEMSTKCTHNTYVYSKAVTICTESWYPDKWSSDWTFRSQDIRSQERNTNFGVDDLMAAALVEKFTTQLFYAQSVTVNLVVNSTSAGLGIG